MRKATIKRKTRETDIALSLKIDGKGKSRIKTGIGFLDHMLELFTHHGLFDLEVAVKRADLEVDTHHTNEDVGICLGLAVKKALDSKRGIKRFGFYVPMDEALAMVALDLSGRPSLHFDPGDKGALSTGGYSIRDTKEFLNAFTINCGVNMHVDIIRGEDPHHIMEAIFKALGKALDGATQMDKRRKKKVPSTKGRL